MFVVVRYGEKEEGIFNPNCKCISLLNNIRERCVLDSSGSGSSGGGSEEDDADPEIELSDETGTIKNLREFPMKYANEILAERERLILLRVDRKDNGDPVYTPLLEDKDFLTDNFMAQLMKNSLGTSGGSKRNRSNSSRRKAADKSNAAGSKVPTDASKASKTNGGNGTNKGGRASSIGRSKSRVSNK